MRTITWTCRRCGGTETVPLGNSTEFPDATHYSLCDACLAEMQETVRRQYRRVPRTARRPSGILAAAVAAIAALACVLSTPYSVLAQQLGQPGGT